MCGGVYFDYQGDHYRVYFPNPKAQLPVRMRDQSLQLIAWGRRREQPGRLPFGGWARLDSIYSGRWDRYFPRPVKLPVTAFMERDIEGNSHWYDITNGQWIQGLVARIDHEQRVYIVTVEPTMADAVHERWPRILSGGGGTG